MAKAKVKIKSVPKTKKTISIVDVPDVLIEKLKNIYGTTSSGGGSIIEAWYLLRSFAIEEIKGKFSHDEICAMLDAFNGTIIEAKYSVKSDFIKYEIEDSIRYGQFSQAWNFDEKEFYEKIDSLTSAQIFFIIERIKEFWNTEEHTKENAIDNFVLQLSR